MSQRGSTRRSSASRPTSTRSGRTLFDTETLEPFYCWAVRDEVPAHAPMLRRGAAHSANGRRFERIGAYFELLTAPADTPCRQTAALPSWNAPRAVVKLPSDFGGGMANVDTRLVYGAFDRRG